MENSEKQMTPEESLNLIGEVISNTRNNLRTNSFFLLLWGWFIAVAAVIQSFILWNAGRTNDWVNVGLFSAINWAGLVILGVIIQIFYIKRHYVKRGYKTFFEKLISYIWIISGCILFLLVYVAGSRHESPEPYILAALVIPTVTTGIVTRFKPLIYGGLSFILFSVLAVNVEAAWIRSLVSAAALIFGYLIPGYILRSKKQ